MKKVLLSVALITGAFSLSFAQQRTVRDAKRAASGSNPDFAKAEQLIGEALQNPETSEDAATWDVAGFIQKSYIEEEQKKQYLKKPYDTVAVYNSVSKLLDYYAKCDEIAELPDSKGRVRNRYRKANSATVMMFRPELINGGVHYFNNNENKEALNFFMKYLESATHPMLADQNLTETDENFPTIAYYATLAGMRLEDYEAITKVAPYAVNDSEEGMQALELLSHAYKMLEDDEKFLETLQTGMEKFPDHLFFFGNVIDFYVNKEDLDAAFAIADKKVGENPDNSYYVYVKGFILHHKKEYNDAADCFIRAIELDPENAEAYSNLGLAYSIQAQEILDAVPVDLDIQDPDFIKANEQAVELYKKALPNYEKARELKPDEKNLWLQGLYLIYYKLGMEELEEVEAILQGEQ